MERLDEKIQQTILTAQKNEITDYFIYQKLASIIKDKHNKGLLKIIAQDELKHHNFWKKYTQKSIKANRFKIWLYYLIARTLGLTFGVKLMEKGEEDAQSIYKKVIRYIPEAENILHEEERHEKDLLHIINEEKLKYIGSMVLGLNDALVELTGALAGLTLALRNTRLIAMAGLITGVAASFSMAASEYLSIKSEENDLKPLKASLYTGLAYIFTVLFLIFPYLILNNHYFSLGLTLFNALVIIFIFNFYIAVAKDVSFKKRFIEMSLISLGIAGLSFGFGLIIRNFFKLEV